jgi:hypothetical protein
LRLEQVRKAINLYDNCCDQKLGDDQFCSLLMEFANKQVQFPAAIRHKLLARRLSQIVQDIKDEKRGATDMFVRIVNPFCDLSQAGGEKTDDAAADSEVYEVLATKDARLHDDPMPFNPRLPEMNQMLGTLSDRIELSHNILVYDVLKALIQKGEEMAGPLKIVAKEMSSAIENGIADLEEVPPTTEEAHGCDGHLHYPLNVLRLLRLRSEHLAIWLWNRTTK